MPNVNFESSLGHDLSVVNAAKASYASASTTLGSKEAKLIKFLGDHGHTSPFRHAAIRMAMRTTFAERIEWERPAHGPSFYGAGMQFHPSLGDLLAAGHGLADLIDWRWTASIQAIGTWVKTFEREQLGKKFGFSVIGQAAQLFPNAINALTGIAFESATNRDYEPRASGYCKVLNDGYVSLVDMMPAATDDETMVTFEVRAPFFVRSQWFKYVRNSAHDPAIVLDLIDGSGNGDDCDWGDNMYARNELSRRYVRDKLSFYIPNEDSWRTAPENSKQGSGEPADLDLGTSLTSSLTFAVMQGMDRYAQALNDGIAPEQARLMLPAYALYTNWYWTASLSAIKFFLAQRLGHDAQYEIRLYAQAVQSLLQEESFDV